MALENSNNFFNATRGVLGLFAPLNKSRKPDDTELVQSEILPEFSSALKDEDIQKLVTKWESDYENYLKTNDISQQQKSNLDYWTGKQFNELQTSGRTRPLVDNLIFEAVETFLPIATKGDPEANVTILASFDDEEEMLRQAADKLAKAVQNALQDEADTQYLRMILKGVTRDWAIYMIGCGKIVWNPITQKMETEKVLPSRLILDPHARIGVDGTYYGEYLGEKKRASASKLTKLFPSKAAVIKAKVDGNMGTKLTYVEWWTQLDTFFTLDKEVLAKHKNPHWNYSTDTVEGKNHFAQPEIPYLFLSIFNIGRRPHDETSLIWQNIPMQDVINRRYQQIDRNVDAQNNGIVLSGTHFTKEQAAEAATQLAKGNPLWVPSGAISDSYVRDSAPALASDVFAHLEDARGELRNIFGTSGSTPQGLDEQKSVRGKILVSQMDSSRIGGGITEYLERWAGKWFNWQVQMMYVYWTEPHTFSSSDKHGAVSTELVNTDFAIPLKVVVKDGSLLPKDPLTQRNEAMDLWAAQAIDPISLYEKLDFPNPYESAKELVMWQMIQKGAMPPQAMFPDIQAPQSGAPVGGGVVSPEEQAQGEIQPPAQPTAQGASEQLIKSVPMP